MELEILKLRIIHPKKTVEKTVKYLKFKPKRVLPEEATMAKFKVICLFFGFLILINPLSSIYAKNNVENVPFDVKQVIEQVTSKQKSHHKDHRTRSRKIPNRIAKSLQDEFMIDTTRFFIPGNYEASPPSITYDGNNYFVVWGDYNQEAVMGSRVNQAGEILDKPSIKIVTAYGEWEGDKPSVAYGGGVYLSVWSDCDREIIFGARTSIEGVPLDTIPIPICTTYYNYRPSVAFDGSNFMVVWDNEDDIIGARVSPAGIVLDTIGIIISNAFNDQYEPTICFGLTNYFVAWTDCRSGYSSIYGTRVNPEGAVLDSIGIRISPTTLYGNSNPVVTFCGSNYFTVWELDIADIYGARIDQNGIVLDTSGIVICSNYPSQFPSVTFDGINFFAVWSDAEEENLYGRRIDTNGIVLDTGRIKICTFQETYYPAVVFGGSYFFVVWDDYRYDLDIYGTRVNNEGIVIDSVGIPVSYSVNIQVYSKVTFDGTNYFVVWWSHTEDGSGIYGSRVSPTGMILDPTGILIRTPVYMGYRLIKVIYGDSNYFVLWQEYDSSFNLNLYGCRVNPDGIILDTSGIEISAEYGIGQPQVIFGDNNYFVVWTDLRAGFYNDIYGARISSTGEVLDPDGIPISTANDYQRNPQVAFDGANYFVFWVDERNGGYNNSDIYGARVNTSGVVLDTVGIPISTANHRQDYFSMVFDGTNYMLVWEDERAVNFYSDIYGARVTQNGVVLDPNGIIISIANDDQYNPQIIFGDNKFFVVWQDNRNDNNDIYAARLTSEGFVLDSAGIPISSGDYSLAFLQVIFDGAYYVLVWQKYISGSGTNIYGARLNPVTARIDTFIVSNEVGIQYEPAIVYGPDNQVFVTYTGWTHIYQGKPYYTDRIWGKFVPAPGIEETKVVSDINYPIFMNSPNPFNHSTTIKYTIRKSGDISLKVFDITGKLVRNLVSGNKVPGIYSINWDGSDDLKKKLPSGVYFYQLKTLKGKSETKELVILR